MGPIAKEIKRTYDRWDKRYGNRDRIKDVCKSNPFEDDQWYFSYLFPEILIVFEDYANKQVQRYMESHTAYNLLGYRLFDGQARIFPCWVMPEEDVLRVMGEVGII